ncbi:phosphatidylinositol 4-phosphate 5-kinase 1-like [Iris pallida]|uniref:Phosphatidylinositol 4-phosphate 5-kinase 1-like n=1 Tax=Iris pallida TaxID=29817 RepID=A0AAX6E9L8_IRIPA|nr:phosphatidylinositol 4-phosphate 5-kinase 1-like [Iris pallida]
MGGFFSHNPEEPRGKKIGQRRRTRCSSFFSHNPRVFYSFSLQREKILVIYSIRT